MTDVPPWRPPTEPPIESLPAPEPPAKRNVGAIVAVVVTAVVLVTGAVFALTRITSSETGGAASPEALGDQVFDAIEGRDVLGLVDVLVPVERDVFREPLIELFDELRRLEVLGDGADLDGLAGFDVVVERRSVQTRPTNVDDITNIVLAADITVEVDGRSLPIGDLLLDTLDGADMSELDTTVTEPFEVTATAVEVDGRWYLSAFFSIAESARGSLSVVPDIPTDGIEPTGGDTPEDALDAVLAGVEALDLGQVIAALNPGEAAALQRYAPLFIDDGQRELDAAPLVWRITEAEYTVRGSGDTRDATIDALSIEGEGDGLAFSVEYVDGCVRVSADGEEFDSCAEDGGGLMDGPVDLDELLADSPAAAELVDIVGDAFADYEQPGITLRRTDGRWFVSPIGSGFDQILAVLRALDRGEIESIAEAFPPALDELFGGFFGVGGGFDPLDPFDPEAPWDDPLDDDGGWFEYPDDDETSAGGDTIGDDDGRDDDPSGDSAAEQCYAEFDVVDASACFEAGVADGSIEVWEVPAELLFPECGAAEAQWGGYHRLGDEEFIALVEAASSCFATLVASGELDEFNVPLGFDKPECFEGRNWYNVFDDPEYDDRFWSCLGY